MPQVVDHGLDHVAQGRRLHVHDDLAGLEPRDGEQVLDEEGEAVGVAVDGLEEPDHGLALIHGAAEQRLGVALDQGERGSQLMADVGHELPALILQALVLRQVVKHEQGAREDAVGVAQGHGADLERPGRRARQIDLVVRDPSLLHGPGGEGGDAGERDDVGDGLAPALGGQPQQAQQGRVHVFDAALGVEDQDALEHAVEKRLLLGLLLDEGEVALRAEVSEAKRLVAKPVTPAALVRHPDRNERRDGAGACDPCPHAV